MSKLRTLLTLSTLLFAVAAVAGDQPRAYIISPAHGQVVTSPVLVQFGLDGYGVAPAGVAWEGTGHHHLLINVDSLPDRDKPIPTDDQHRHFGGGQTEALLDLEPGTYTLQLLLGDETHIPHDPPIKSEPITIQVKSP